MMQWSTQFCTKPFLLKKYFFVDNRVAFLSDMFSFTPVAHLPQPSPLKPSLFIVSYAATPGVHSFYAIFENYLTSLTHWLSQVGPKLNVKKSRALPFTRGLTVALDLLFL